jgi:hypothetical protein
VVGAGEPNRAAANRGRASGSTPGGVFKVVLGAALGMLVAALVVPSHRASEVRASSGAGRGSATGAGGANGPAANDASGASDASSAGGAGVSPSGGTGADTTVAGGGAVAGRAAGATSSGAARGVTDTTITVGVAYLNLSGVQYLGPDYDVGDVRAQWNAVLAGWTRRGLLPVAGRTIKLAFHDYSVLDASQQRSACAAMIQDDHVFAVVAPEYFYQQGASCVAAENHTPVITSDGPANAVYRQAAPNLYTIMLSSTDQMTNLVYWARDKGLLQNHKIGVYYPNDPASQQLVDEGLRAPLQRIGSKITATATTGNANGGPEDALAVQRFHSAGVDLVVLMTSDLGFLQQADAQGYRPHYMGSDYNGYTTYLNAENFPADQFDGSPAVTVTDRGTLTTGAPLSPSARQCLDDYNQFTGAHLSPPPPGGHETAAYVYVMLACDESQLMLKALQAAGRNLTTATFEAGLASIRNQPMNYFPDLSFGPGRYEGVQQERTLAWRAKCKCWVADGSAQPLSMPG